MAGVLQRLALRALPAHNRVRPRLPGRFESADEGGEGYGQPGASAVPTVAAPPAAAAWANSIETGLPARADGSEASSPTGMLKPPALAFVATPQLPKTVVAEGQLPPASGTAPDAATWQMPMIRELGQPPPLSAESEAMAPTISHFPPITAALNEPASRAAAATIPSLLLPELRMLGEAPHPLASTASPAMVPPDREPPPDVHISIGRIEVRAEPAPLRKPPPPSRPRPKLMSLEEYLGRGRGP